MAFVAIEAAAIGLTMTRLSRFIWPYLSNGFSTFAVTTLIRDPSSKSYKYSFVSFRSRKTLTKSDADVESMISLYMLSHMGTFLSCYNSSSISISRDRICSKSPSCIVYSSKILSSLSYFRKPESLRNLKAFFNYLSSAYIAYCLRHSMKPLAAFSLQ